MSTLSGGPNIVTDGLILHLDAANTKSYVGGSTTWNDLSRGSNNGTLVNGPTFDSGNGGSIVFDGVNDYATINNNNLYLPPTTDRTLEIWTRIISFPPSQGGLIAGQKSSTGALMVLSTGKFSWYWDDSATVNSTVTMELNKWYQIVLVLRNSYFCTYYVNGFQDLAEFRTSDLESGQVTVWSIGRQNRDFSGDLFYLNCDVSMHRQYNRLLTPSEILQNYNATKTRFGL
jgi:hypothetical protein